MISIRKKEDEKYANKMRQAQQGDNKAYEALLKEITPLIAGFIYNRIGKKSDNEDILQDILIAIHRSSQTYNTQRSFKGWMFAIADHKLKDYFRSYYRKRILTQVDFDDVKDFLTNDVTNDAPLGESLIDLVDALPPKQKKIIYMMKVEGYTAKEVALAVNMSVSAVKVAAHRAYKVIGKIYSEKEKAEKKKEK